MTTANDNTTTAIEDATTSAATELATLKADLANLGESVAHMAGLIVADVPERFKTLIPEGLSPAAQAAWCIKARQAGFFGPVAVPQADHHPEDPGFQQSAAP
jgi:hypothetical protein